MDYIKRDSEMIRRSCFSYSFSLDIILERISEMIDHIQDHSWISREVYLSSKLEKTPQTKVDIRVYRSVTDFMNKIILTLNKAASSYQKNLDILSKLYENQTGMSPNELSYTDIEPNDLFNKTLARSLTQAQLKKAGSNIKKVMRLVEYHAENLKITLVTISERLISTKGNVTVSEDTIRNMKDCLRLIKHVTKKYEITFDTFKDDHPEEENQVATDKEKQERTEEENRRRVEQREYDQYYQYYYSQKREYGENHRKSKFKIKTPEEEKIEESYHILKITPSASFEEVKKAYKSMIKKYHPDLYHNDEERKKNAEDFTRILNRAYEELEKYYSSPDA